VVIAHFTRRPEELHATNANRARILAFLAGDTVTYEVKKNSPELQ